MPAGKFAVRDCVAIVVVLLLVIVLAAPTMGRLRSTSKREQCLVNLQRIGTAAKIYANEDQEKWPIPAFKRTLVGNVGIDYLNDRGVWWGEPTDPGEVGFDRSSESTNETHLDPTGGSTAVSVTRSLWIMVRSGDAAPAQLVCPSSRDVVDPGDILFDHDYYDFATYRNVSYGYQVPFGPRETQPHEWVDHRMVLLADKGPYYTDRFEPSFLTRLGRPITVTDDRREWRPYNSPNHGGQGQNMLRADGSGYFLSTPLGGVNGDNIYTLMTDGWDETGFNRIHGQSPHHAGVPNPYPGQIAFGMADFPSTTDSLIYP